MTLRCALCGRMTLNPAVMVGAEPIGPKCAKRSGLLAIARRPGSSVRIPTGPRRKREAYPENLDVFEVHA